LTGTNNKNFPENKNAALIFYLMISRLFMDQIKMPDTMDGYLDVNASYDNDSVIISLGGREYRIKYPEDIWNPLREDVKTSIVDHLAFLATNYLPIVAEKKGVRYNTRLPMFDCFSFKSNAMDMPSSAVLDWRNPYDYVRDYINLDFVFSSERPIVWRETFETDDTVIISFTSGKESLLTLAVCLELGLNPILINIVEPSNTYEKRHKAEILKGINEEFKVQYYTVPHEVGLFHDARHMGLRPTSLGWGNQLMYYLFIYLPFIIKHRAKYLFYGNEHSCDFEVTSPEGFRSNFCYDQSSHWTIQQDIILRTLTGGSASVGSLVGPLNEIAVVKCLHKGFPELAKYQMSCFCEDEVTREYRWCCNCSKCARNYAFIKAIGGDTEKVGFWREMFSEECEGLFSALNGKETYGFDRSGLGREEQELALLLASNRNRGDPFLQKFRVKTDLGMRCEEADNDPLNSLEEYYFTPQEYPAIPEDFKERVYEIYERLLKSPEK